MESIAVLILLSIAFTNLSEKSHKIIHKTVKIIEKILQLSETPELAVHAGNRSYLQQNIIKSTFNQKQ